MMNYEYAYMRYNASMVPYNYSYEQGNLNHNHI